MNRLLIATLLSMGAAAAAGPLAHAQTQPTPQPPQTAPLSPALESAVTALQQAGLRDTAGLKFVEDLTTEVGPRLAGSEAEARARAWAIRRLTAMGFENVRSEEFPVPYWARITESAEVVAPSPQKLVITALGGSTATPAEGITAQIVRYTSLEALDAAPAADVQGRIVFLDEYTTRTQDGSGYGVGVAKRRSCTKYAVDKGGLACLIRSVGTQHRRFAHTGMMQRPSVGGAGPGAALSPPDADQLARLLQRGPVSVKLTIRVEMSPSVPSGNVIAEIRGRSKPQQIVLIGCHLDSWDSSPGALDDAAGCGIVVGAAKLIMERGERPERTIRVVLYGSEEVGLFGAEAYARRHADDLVNHVIAAESDFGAGPIWRFDTRVSAAALPYARALQRAVQPLGVGPGHNDSTGGPDLGPLRRAGVPIAGPQQDGTDYFDYHHTPDDTFDKIVPAQFRQNVAVYASFAWLAAATDWDFRKP
jgi:hypothetical protein